MPDVIYDIAVIGGGASGLMAALSAIKTCPSLRIVVLERLNRVGKKLMATGNGRCNLTNISASEADYHGNVAFMRPAMSAFPPEKVMARFIELGVYPRREPDGRVYPMSDQASSVLDVLRLTMEENSVEEICDFEVVSLTRGKHGYRLVSGNGRQVIARRIICAAGGLTAPSLGGSASGYHLLESCGHELTPRFPALVQLKTHPEFVRPLKGIRYTGEIDLLIDDRVRRTENGEILFTEYGLSGIAVMQLSRLASQAFHQKHPPAVSVRLHLLPMKRTEALRLLFDRRKALALRPLENFLTGLVHKRVGQMIVKWTLGLNLNELSSTLTDEHLSSLADALTGWKLDVVGTQGFDQAQVTAGGIRTEDVNSQTLESFLADGLYITGEILDIDGDCGGYNLQWAWASGMLAGESCARSSLANNAETGGKTQDVSFHPSPVLPNRPKQRAKSFSETSKDVKHPPNDFHRKHHPAKQSSPFIRNSKPAKGMKKPHD